jgi:hypothetical protein
LKKKVLHLTLCIHVSCTPIHTWHFHLSSSPYPLSFAMYFFISSNNLSQYQIK